MHTGSPAELRVMEARSQEIGRQIAGLLEEAEAVAPGSVSAQVTGLGWTVQRRGSNFVVITR